MALDLEAIERIKQLKARYFRGIDTADHELIAPCLAPDISVHFVGGSYELEMQGADEVLGFLKQAFHSEAAASHWGHHPEIEVTGNTATGIWYLHDVFFNLGSKSKTSGAAIYEDEYVKQNDQWLIRHTGYTRVWERVETFEDADSFTVRRLAKTGAKTA